MEAKKAKSSKVLWSFLKKEEGFAPTSSNISFYCCNDASLIGRRACRVLAWLKTNPSTAPRRLQLPLRECGDRNIHYVVESVSNLIDPKFLFKWHWSVLTGAGAGITKVLTPAQELNVKSNKFQFKTIQILNKNCEGFFFLPLCQEHVWQLVLQMSKLRS